MSRADAPAASALPAAGEAVAAGAAAPSGAELDDAALLRYSRHILLDQIGIEGQRRLLKASALVIGAGGLGSAALLYLASAGVGHIIVADADAVDASNLQRQIAHAESRIGMPKVLSAKAAMLALNPTARITALQERANAAWLAHWVPQVDVVLDCSDNFATRQAVNAACVKHGKALVSGAAVGFDGQVSVFAAGNAAPCYACVFPPGQALEDVRCATMGVFAPLVGIIGSVQAAEALKLLAGVGESLQSRLLMLDARSMRWDEMRLQRDCACPVCGQAARACATAPSPHSSPPMGSAGG